MVKANFIEVEEPYLAMEGDVEASGLMKAEFVDTLDPNHEMIDSIGEVEKSLDMYLPNFSLRIFEGTLNRDAQLVYQDERGGKYVGSCFFLESKIFSHMPGYEDRVGTFNKSHNFKFDPYNEMEHYLPANSKLNFVHFSYRKEFLSEVLPDNVKWADKIRAHLDQEKHLFGSQAKHLNQGQERALQNIFDCQLQGKWSEMFIESSFAQLLHLQMKDFFDTEETSALPGFSKRDVEVMYALKAHLMNTFLEEHSMLSLARHFGLNTNKLMTQFKRLFGMSVFEFLTQLRMDYAGQLLRDKNMMVVEVAQTLGYKNPNHFSAAFKKRFGIIPSAFSKA
ncbi:MAG: AraC family transcriptional regulator [Cyclobacteriaceae bacterium]